MELGIYGLGRMGSNMAARLIRAGHRVVGTSRSRETVEEAIERGVIGVFSPEDLVAELSPRRAVWIMVPAGKPTEDVIETFAGLLSQDDIIIDGGNSNYQDTMRRAASLKERGINMVDVGTSGGIWGLTEGYGMMVGGDDTIVAHLCPLLEALAPAPDKGWAHLGPSGAGHFVKMVHNGIEYGMMEAYAEGFALLARKGEFDLDLQRVAEAWRHGTVIRSWLLDLISKGLAEEGDLSRIAPYVQDSGEGRWTVQEAIDQDLAAPVMTLALLQRLRSRDEFDLTDRLLAMMRNQFGGHAMKREESTKNTKRHEERQS